MGTDGPDCADVAGFDESASGYYWVCLRRPANLFAPVSAHEPDGRGRFDAVPVPRRHRRRRESDRAGRDGLLSSGGAERWLRTTGNYRLLGSAVSALSRRACRAGAGADGQHVPTPASRPRRFRSTRGTGTPSRSSFRRRSSEHAGHCHAARRASITTTRHRHAPPSTTRPRTSTTRWDGPTSTSRGRATAGREPWDYFPFNDRDFTSVAELMLVPGCSPGLFTKQFVEFAPAAGNVSNIFNAVIPNASPADWTGQAATIGAASATAATTTGGHRPRQRR